MKHSVIYRTIIFLLAVVVMTACESRKPVRHSAMSAGYLAEASAGEKGVESIVTTVAGTDKNGPEIVTSMTFDSEGRIISESNNNGNRAYAYDEFGAISAVGDDTVKAEYNEEGDLTHIHFNDIDSANPSDVYFTYDEAGRVTEHLSTRDTMSMSIYYEYTSEGLPSVKQVRYPWISSTINYDEKGLMATRTDFDSDGKEIRTINYTYKFDDEGNWIKAVGKVKPNKWSRPKTFETITREISYYDGPYLKNEAVAAAAPVMAAVSHDSAPGRSGIDRYFDNLSYRFKMAPYTLGTSSTTMFIIMIVLTILGAGFAIWYGAGEFGAYENLLGEPGANGMKRVWMYNWRPYQAVLYTMGCILVGLIASILVLLIVGGIFWGLMWVVKGILWCLYYLGWILAILGGLALFGKEPMGCLALIVGIFLISCEKWIERTGEMLVGWGENFLESANFFGFGLGLFTNFWDVIVLIVFAPIALFVAFALVIIIFNLLLTGAEWVFTKIYSINRPCPQCGKHADYDYIIDGTPHPVSLRPGIYGSFHHTHYDRFDIPEYRIPTMLLNGRDRLDRRCRACGAMINTSGVHSVGTDVHIGLVGHVGVGKTYLIFSGLEELIKEFGDDIEQVDNADRNLDVEVKSSQIHARRDIQTDRRTSYRAVQLMLKRSNHLVPYHLHFYDVAGEQFTTNTALNDDAMRFYTNVQSIVVVIDPLMIDTQAPGVRATVQFEQWQKEKNPRPMRYNPAEILASLNAYLEKYGRSTRKIDLTFVLVKSDTGYFEAMGYSANPDSDRICEFMKKELGMTTLVNTGEMFRSVSFHATSVYTDNRSTLRELFFHLLRQRKISC